MFTWSALFAIAIWIFCWKVVFPLLRILFVYSFGKLLFSKRKQLKKAGKWAIVTGSTAGIGKAYAEELASDGLNIMLISRNPEKLKNVATEIEAKYNVETRTVTCDFTKTDVYEMLESEIKTLPSIACLVNNIGMSYSTLGAYANADWITTDFVRQMISCNVNSVAGMTRIVLPILLKQQTKGAAIINVGSLAGSLPIPYFTLYCATKAFMKQMTEALYYELEGSNVLIQIVCPSLVATAMTNIEKTSFFVPNASQFAASALDMLGVETVGTGYFSHALRSILLFLHPRVVVSFSKSMYKKIQEAKLKQG